MFFLAFLRDDAIFSVFHFFFLDCVLVAVVSSTRFIGGVLLGPLSLVTSVPIASTPNPHLCASSLVFSCAFRLLFSCAFRLVLLVLPLVC